jgi:hypothetical protein
VLLGSGDRDQDLIFTKPNGEPLHPERVSREFDRRIERWGLPRIPRRGLRHLSEHRSFPGSASQDRSGAHRPFGHCRHIGSLLPQPRSMRKQPTSSAG